MDIYEMYKNGATSEEVFAAFEKTETESIIFVSLPVGMSKRRSGTQGGGAG